MATCHERRNLAEYEGALDVDERLLADLMDPCRRCWQRSVRFNLPSAREDGVSPAVEYRIGRQTARFDPTKATVAQW
jgi:hypothetical protein